MKTVVSVGALVVLFAQVAFAQPLSHAITAFYPDSAQQHKMARASGNFDTLLHRIQRQKAEWGDRKLSNYAKPPASIISSEDTVIAVLLTRHHENQAIMTSWEQELKILRFMTNGDSLALTIGFQEFADAEIPPHLRNNYELIKLIHRLDSGLAEIEKKMTELKPQNKQLQAAIINNLYQMDDLASKIETKNKQDLYPLHASFYSSYLIQKLNRLFDNTSDDQ